MVCEETPAQLYFDGEGFTCQNHKRPGAKPLLPAVGVALSHVLENEGKQIFGFRLSPEALEQLDKVMRQYLQMQTFCGGHLFLKKIKIPLDILLETC